MKTQFLAIIAATSLLTACAQPGGAGFSQGGSGINKQEAGTALGAIGGGIAGSAFGGGHGRIATTIAGTLLGGFLGNQVGSSLDNADRAEANRVTQRALETAQPGQALPWNGQNASGTVVPSNYYRNEGGQYCREYTQTVKVGGKTQNAYGTACRQPDGAWQVVSQ